MPAPDGGLGRSVIGQGSALAGHPYGRPPNGPGHRLGRRGAVVPLVIGAGGKGGVIAARVGAAGGAAHGQLGGVVAAPDGGLGRSVIGQGPALFRDPHDNGPPDGPGHALGVRGAVPPLVALHGCKDGRICPGVGSRGLPADSQGGGVVVVPDGCLLRPCKGQHAALTGHRVNGAGQVCNGFLRRFCGLLGRFCRRHGRRRVLQCFPGRRQGTGRLAVRRCRRRQGLPCNPQGLLHRLRHVRVCIFVVVVGLDQPGQGRLQLRLDGFIEINQHVLRSHPRARRIGQGGVHPGRDPDGNGEIPHVRRGPLHIGRYGLALVAQAGVVDHNGVPGVRVLRVNAETADPLVLFQPAVQVAAELDDHAHLVSLDGGDRAGARRSRLQGGDQLAGGFLVLHRPQVHEHAGQFQRLPRHHFGQQLVSGLGDHKTVKHFFLLTPPPVWWWR